MRAKTRRIAQHQKGLIDHAVRRGLTALAACVLCACGGGNETADTSTQGLGTRRAALAAPTSLAVSIESEADPMFAGLTIPADAPTKGMWSGIYSWPLNAIHLTLLPDGRVLGYGSIPGDPFVYGGAIFDSWTPSLGFGPDAHNTTEQVTQAESFCSTATVLLDGNFLVVGGVASKESSVARWVTRDVVDSNIQMASDRWYATATTLADGRVVVVGGMDINSEGVLLDTPDEAVANGIVSMTPELMTPGAGWRSLPGATNRLSFGPEQVRASYPKSWVAPNGLVFGISVDTMWQLDVDASAGAGSTTILGTFKTPYGLAIPANVGTTATAVMYAPGRILQAGGNGGVASEAIPGAREATLFDINGPAPVVTETKAMVERRRMGSSAVLPNGQVLVTGGSRFANQGGTSAVFAAEIWNPGTGQWTTGASAAVERVYHSGLLLLPNGALLSTAGNGETVANENAEIYYPPYLFRSVNGVAELAPRPVLTGINSRSVGHGGALRLELAAGQTASRLVLVRTGTVTHAFNNSQRFIELPFKQTGDLIDATWPANSNIAPPGYYHVMVLDAAGVPSRSVIVGLGLTGSTSVPVPTLARDQALALRSIGTPGVVIGSDAGGQGVTLATADATAAPAAAQFLVRNGLADAKCVSLESKTTPGTWLRHASLRLGVAASDASADFAARATFCPEQAPGARGFVLRSKSHPGYLLRHRNGEVWIDLETPTNDFVASSAFEAVSIVVNQAPTLSITSPNYGSSAVAGTAVTLNTNPGDVDGYIARVEFYDGATLIGTRTSGPWSLNWQGAIGSHTLTARAFDDKGASGTSPPVVVNVKASNVAPTLSILTPLAGSAPVVGTPLTITTNPGDVDGYITRVEFYDGATLIGTRTQGPWSLDWTGAVGSHTLTAKAFDDTGASGVSPAVTMSIRASNALPTLSITAPVSGTSAVVGTALTLTTNPGDVDGYITRLDFYDGATLIGTRTVAPWSLDWTGAVGSHTLTAVATDNSGGTGTSPPVNFTIKASNAAPTLAITAPAAGSSFVSGRAITLSTNPGDVDGYIRRVEFYDGAVLIGTATQGPWSITWNSSGVGSRVLTAKAFDDTGASTVSLPVTVTLTPY